MSTANEDELLYEVNNGWQRFVYIFSTVSANSAHAPVMPVTSPAYWSIEAVLLFLVILAVIVGNAYFGFASCSSGTKAEEPKPEKERNRSGSEAPTNRKEGTTEETRTSKPESITQEESTVERVAEVVETPTVISDLEENKGEATVTKLRKKPILYYLGNLKWALIELVYLGHCGEYVYAATRPEHGEMFLFVTKSLIVGFAMPLFIFVSAYFVPLSIERKGIVSFRKDKLKRLGIPMVFLVLVLNPLEVFLRTTATDQTFEYTVVWQVAWFQLWLQIFNEVYLIISPFFQSREVPLPGTITLVAFGLVIGLVQGGIGYAQGGDFFMWGFLRLQWALAPAFASFYFLGTQARRNNWLREIPKRRTIHKISMLVVAIASGVGVGVASWHRNRWSVLAASMVWGASCGIFCVSFNYVIIDVFATWCNTNSLWTQFLGRGAYTVYLIQSIFILIMLYIWILILGAADIDAVNPPNDWWTLWAGLFCAIVGSPLIFILAFFICKIPVVKDIV